MTTVTESNRSTLSALLLTMSVAAFGGGCENSDTQNADGTSDGSADGASDGNVDGADADTATRTDATDADASEAETADVGTPAAPTAVHLGTAGTFAVLAKTGVSTVPASAITGDLGVSPAAATYITGFALTTDATNVFSISTQVTGKVFASDYAAPTPAMLTTAIGDLQIAFTDAASRAPKTTELGAGNIGGLTLTPGVYKWSTGLLVPTNVNLAGSATDVWIFQIAKDLTVSNGVKITLTGGALPKNVFWQVSGFAELGTTAHLEGIVLAQTAIRLRTGASVTGRLLAQTAVELDNSTVVAP